MLPIVNYPSLILRKRTKRVKNILSPEIQSFTKELIKTMIKEDGLGLAANQVNADQQILAVNFQDQPMVFINPVIYYKSWSKESGEEGCLSFPGVFGLVSRSVKINLFYYDDQGRLRHLRAKGLLARVLQHEIDHLRGILFIDRMVKYTKGEDKIKAWRNAGRPEEL